MRLLMWAIPIIYYFIAFLPIPKGIEIGLDPSWQYGLSRASADQLIFGRDIVFTYGPLGYLISGTALDENFLPILFFRGFISFLLFGLAYIKILKLPTKLGKISFILSLLIAFMFSRLPSRIDQQVLFIFIIILSFYNGKLTRYIGLLLGLIAGLCLSLKINIGVSVFGASLILLLSNFYVYIKNKLDKFFIVSIIVDLLLSTISVIYIILDNNHLLSLLKLIIAVLLAATVGLFMGKLNNRIIKGKFLVRVARLFNSNRAFQKIFKARITGWSGFYLTYSFCLILMIFYFSHPLIGYLKGGLEISYGYSSAMSLIGSIIELRVGIFEFILILILLIFLFKESESTLGFSLSIAFILWMTFKHGFIRQDTHVLRFFASTPLIVSICISRAKNFNIIKLSGLIHIYVLTVMLIYGLISEPFGNKNFTQGVNNISALAPEQVVTKVLDLINLSKLQERVNQKSYANLSKLKLKSNVIDRIKNEEIDIIPSEISLVGANKLNWKPRPIFQSYSAYTTFLDNLNKENLSKNPREYILYKFDSIDGRYPLFDEPKTFFYVFCNYHVDTQIPDFINLPGISNLILLTKLNTSHCSPGQIEEKIALPWNTDHKIEVADGQLVRANIYFKYSLFGRIYNAIFRTPPINIFVTDMNGVEHKYRIVAATAENGIIISHLPANDDEMLFFLKGHLPVPIKSFRFSTSNNLLYKPNIDINFMSYNLRQIK